jgi:predicted Zn-dependent peptidase
MSEVRKDVLPNGLTILTEAMPAVRSVSMGIWLRTGSRQEGEEENGISHFIEHMVFKGTKNRSAEQIAREADSIGQGVYELLRQGFGRARAAGLRYPFRPVHQSSLST